MKIVNMLDTKDKNQIHISQSLIGNENVNSVNARDLWKSLESKQKFADWIKARIEKLRLIENTDFITLRNQENKGFGGDVKSIEYIITIDIAKHLCLIEMTDIGHKVREYFIECEKQLRETSNFKLPQTYAEALRELADTHEALELAKAQIESDKPKVEAFETLMDSKDAIDFLHFSKIIGIGRTTLFEELRDRGILNRNNIPYQQYVDSGYFRVVESTYTQGENTRTYCKTMILPKGQEWLIKKIKD